MTSTGYAFSLIVRTDEDYIALEAGIAEEREMDARAEAEAALTPAQRDERAAAALVAEAEMYALMPWLAPYVADYNDRSGL